MVEAGWPVTCMWVCLFLQWANLKGEGWAGADRQEANGAASGDPARPFNSHGTIYGYIRTLFSLTAE